MTKKPVVVIYWTVIIGSFFLANYAAQQRWPLWIITVAGGVSLMSVLAYLFTVHSES